MGKYFLNGLFLYEIGIKLYKKIIVNAEERLK